MHNRPSARKHILTLLSYQGYDQFRDLFYVSNPHGFGVGAGRHNEADVQYMKQKLSNTRPYKESNNKNARCKATSSAFHEHCGKESPFSTTTIKCFK